MKMHVNDSVTSIAGLHSVNVIQYKCDCWRAFPSLLFKLKVKFGSKSIDCGVVAASYKNSTVYYSFLSCFTLCLSLGNLEAEVQLIDQTVIVKYDFIFNLLYALFSFQRLAVWLLLNGGNFPLKQALVIGSDTEQPLVVLSQLKSL